MSTPPPARCLAELILTPIALLSRGSTGLFVGGIKKRGGESGGATVTWTRGNKETSAARVASLLPAPEPSWPVATTTRKPQRRHALAAATLGAQGWKRKGGKEGDGGRRALDGRRPKSPQASRFQAPRRAGWAAACCLLPAACWASCRRPGRQSLSPCGVRGRSARASPAGVH